MTDAKESAGFKDLVKHIKDQKWDRLPADLRDITAEILWKFLQPGVLITAMNFIMLQAVVINQFEVQKIIPLSLWVILAVNLIAYLIFSHIWVDILKMPYRMTEAQRKRSEPLTKILKNQKKLQEDINIIKGKIENITVN